MATEAAPGLSKEDIAFREANPLPEEIAAEDARMLEALQRGDLATFSLWLQQRERQLGEFPDAIAHAHLLTRAARILFSAGEQTNAVTLLQRAAALAKDNTDELKNITVLLHQIGGDAAVAGLKAQQRRALRERNNAIQKQLVALQAADAPPPDPGVIVKLKAELNELIRREQELR